MYLLSIIDQRHAVDLSLLFSSDISAHCSITGKHTIMKKAIKKKPFFIAKRP